MTDATETVSLYRPVGPRELALIREAGYAAFPPRLPEHPIFYPVLNEEYAARAAAASEEQHRWRRDGRRIARGAGRAGGAQRTRRGTRRRGRAACGA